MKALRYLMATRLKNKLKLLAKSPGQLIFVLLILALLAFTVFAGGQTEQAGQYRPISEVYAMVFLLNAFVFLQTAHNGFSNGASLYTMQDVNLVFPAPISVQRVLFYGLVRQMGTSLLLGFFLLFQYSWLAQGYGIDFCFLIVILLGYAISVFCGQLSAMVLYSLSSGREKMKRNLQRVFYLVIFAFLCYLAAVVIPAEDKLSAAVDVANGAVFTAFPVAGWLRAAIAGIGSGSFLPLFLGILGVTLYILALIFALFRAHTDFYEDVLAATENDFQTKEAAKEGALSESIPKKVRLGQTGLLKGKGAMAFFHKHLLENRRARLFLLDGPSLIFCAFTIVWAFAMKDAGIFPIFIFGAYLQVFSVALGRITKELLKPYVYLVPEPPFQKLLCCLYEGLLKTVLEALIVFIPVAFILNLSWLEAVMCILARISCGALFLSCNVFVERFFSSVRIKALSFVLYFALLLVFLIPAICAGILLPFLSSSASIANILAFFGIAAANFLVALAALFSSRNLLVYAELNQPK